MDRNSNNSDKELIAQFLKGDEQAFRLLFEKYWHDLYKIAYRRLPSHEDVKDILQEVFISLWKNIPQLSVHDNLGGYLFISLRNRIFNYYEKNQLRLRTLISQPFQPVQSEDDIYNFLNAKELQVFIAETIAKMPPKMGAIYLLSKEKQLTNAEIARLLMLSPQTVKNQIHLALSRIRKELQKNNLHIPLFLF